ncbi:matrix-remodeling-associated protein 7-like [Myxocyprinus asiaticus]|uniref:matrix-remodeling-associated protein 7-like n=1 Tax=Myxocyprinus asiaticus TaxID=70543 RepID=UPI00222144CB|nr:matrix-remodeling-associated protein 7-like [Myxocyprinus asiaticus]
MDAVNADLMWPAMLFTLLAIVVAAVALGKNNTAAPSKDIHSVVEDERVGADNGASLIQHQSIAKPKDESMELVKDSNRDHGEEVCKSDCPTNTSTKWGEDSSEYGIRNALKDYAQSPDAENMPLRYMTGMLRSSQLEKMMTNEELEEELRVQREQLAAIFQLLRDKQDTFGEVTESDLEEQLKLYSI